MIKSLSDTARGSTNSRFSTETKDVVYQIQAMYKAKCETNYDKIEWGVTLFLAYSGDSLVVEA